MLTTPKKEIRVPRCNERNDTREDDDDGATKRAMLLPATPLRTSPPNLPPPTKASQSPPPSSSPPFDQPSCANRHQDILSTPHAPDHHADGVPPSTGCTASVRRPQTAYHTPGTFRSGVPGSPAWDESCALMSVGGSGAVSAGEAVSSAKILALQVRCNACLSSHTLPCFFALLSPLSSLLSPLSSLLSTFSLSLSLFRQHVNVNVHTRMHSSNIM